MNTFFRAHVVKIVLNSFAKFRGNVEVFGN